MVKHVELKNEWGKTLRGYLDYPENFNGEILVFFHGFTGNKSEHAYHFRNFSRLIAKDGYASIRMDFSGNGESDGDFSEFTFDTMMSEAKEIIDYAFNLEGVKRVSLLGFSMGGAVASIMSSVYQNKLSKIILWSAAANIAEHIKNYFEKGVELPNGNKLIATYFELSKEMYASIDKCHPMEGIEKFTNPVLLCHGRNDQCIDYMYSMRYAVKYPNAQVHIIDGANHGYDKVEEQKELYSKSLEFLNFYNDLSK